MQIWIDDPRRAGRYDDDLVTIWMLPHVIDTAETRSKITYPDLASIGEEFDNEPFTGATTPICGDRHCGGSIGREPRKDTKVQHPFHSA
jgi:hypothetical protein